MSAFIYFLIIMLTLLALCLALLALGFTMVKSRRRRVSFRVLGYAVIGIRVALTALLVFAFRDSWVAFTRD